MKLQKSQIQQHQNQKPPQVKHEVIYMKEKFEQKFN